jgi:transposase InsO family protein
MDEKARQEIALFRYSVIGILVSGELSHGAITKIINELSKRRYSIPYSNRKTIGVGTIEDWLYAYRYNGFEGLKPKARSDQGKVRGVPEIVVKAIVGFKEENPRMPLRLIIKTLTENQIIKEPSLPLSTIYRHIRLLKPKRNIPPTGKEQKRFTHRYPNECWQGDVMHGPYIKQDGEQAKKVYLIAFIDDCSRLIVGAQFYFSEATVYIKEVLRTAVLTYGVPSKLYLDNGRNFCADDIELACAAMSTALIHSTPYYPESKGKIERFFRTVRDSFITTLHVKPVHTLTDLNQVFSLWLSHQYNRSKHSSLDGATPLETFLKKGENRIRRLGAHIDPAELFCKKESRLVAKDATFRVNNILYEAEEQLIGKKINVLYDKDDPLKKVKVYDGAVFIHCAKPIDYIANAHAKRKDLFSEMEF